MWNYRIVNVDETIEEDQSLEIREVYYDRQGEPYGHCSACLLYTSDAADE